MTKKDKDETAATKWDIRGVPAARAQVTPPSLAAVAQNPGVIDTRMLRSSFGEHAASYPDPAQWADIAVPFMASLSARHHGTLHLPRGGARYLVKRAPAATGCFLVVGAVGFGTVWQSIVR